MHLRTWTVALLALTSVCDGGLAQSPSVPADPATVWTNATAAGTATDVQIDFNNPRQTIVGFGAADAFYSGWLTAHPNKEQIYDLLFSRDQLGASILRLQNIYGQTTTAPFDPDAAEVVAKANSYRGSPITVLMTSWSPPAALKASGKVACGGATLEPGCTLAKVNGAFNYAGFAQYWYDSLNAYATLGVVPDYVGLQNEPDFTPNGYAGCRFDATEQPGGTYAGYKQALDATSAKLQTMSHPPMLVGPEVVGLGYNVIENYLAALNADELGSLGAVAHHLYHGGDSAAPDSFNPSMQQLASAAPAKQLFQTEFDHSPDQTGALNTAWLIHNAMATEEASAYLYWSLFWPDTNQLVYIDNPWTPSSWSDPQTGYHVTDYYCALEHFSRFVQPGFRRIAAASQMPALRATAYFDQQQHRLVFVLINTSATDTLTPALPLATRPANSNRRFPAMDRSASAAGRPRDPGNNTAIYRSTFSGTDERFRLVGQLTGTSRVTLPPQSVATVVVDGFMSCGASPGCNESPDFR